MFGFDMLSATSAESEGAQDCSRMMFLLTHGVSVDCRLVGRVEGGRFWSLWAMRR